MQRYLKMPAKCFIYAPATCQRASLKDREGVWNLIASAKQPWNVIARPRVYMSRANAYERSKFLSTRACLRNQHGEFSKQTFVSSPDLFLWPHMFVVLQFCGLAQPAAHPLWLWGPEPRAALPIIFPAIFPFHFSPNDCILAYLVQNCRAWWLPVRFWRVVSVGRSGLQATQENSLPSVIVPGELAVPCNRDSVYELG